MIVRYTPIVLVATAMFAVLWTSSATGGAADQVQCLVERWEDPHPPARISAAFALANLGSRAAAALPRLKVVSLASNGSADPGTICARLPKPRTAV